MFGCGTGFFSGNRLLPRPTFTTIAPSQLASWPPAGPSKFLSLRRTAARAPILPAAAGRADSRTMVPANGPAVRCLEKAHLWGVITVLLSTAVCTKFLICTDAPVIETTVMELTTAVRLASAAVGQVSS